MSRARHLLDALQSPAAIDALDPQRYAAEVVSETPIAATFAELEARDAFLTAALNHVDEAIARVTKIRLEHALAQDTSIGAPTRRVFAQTVIRYADNLELLGDRTRELATRGRAADPDGIASTVVDAARASLDLREVLRAGVLAHVRALSLAEIPDVDRRARDQTLDDAARRRWSAVRRDLETLADDPSRIQAAPFATRVASWPEQIDEPAPKPEVHPADLIELD